MKVALWTLTFLFLVACDKAQEAGTPSPQPNPPPSGPRAPDNGGGQVPPAQRYNWTTGATVDIMIPKSSLEAFISPRTVNTNSAMVPAKMNVALTDQDAGSGQAYGGVIRLAYEDMDPSGSGTRYYEYALRTSSIPQYNVVNGYHVANGFLHFKSYAQDAFGSILFIIDARDDSNFASGRVYFHNFRQAHVAQGPDFADACWLIRRGPYDCRDYLDPTSGRDQYEQSMNMSLAVYPYRQWLSSQGEDWGQMYRSFFSFSGLNGQVALNE